MKYIFGNLISMGLNGDFDVLIQGCNIYNTMGGGLALEVRNRIPDAYAADLKTKKGDRSKLGKYTATSDGNLTVVNAYTQATYWDPDDAVNYPAIEKVMETIAYDFEGKIIGMPLIGAGLAGGKWEIIRDIIEKHLPDATIVVFNQADYNKIVAPSFRIDKDTLST